MTVRLAFLLSLPRSGSTLLQRLIATHPEVSTASEPWILLPLLYTMRAEGISAEYDQRHAVRGLIDFAQLIPGGLRTYKDEIRDLALRLYSRASEPNSSWFLDKTPRYYFIAHELVELFPDAKFILLARNPLAVAASVVNQFGKGSWVIPKWEPYLKSGIHRLFSVELMSRCLRVSYEELVTDPNGITASIHRYLGLEPIADPAGRFSEVVLTGSHGDHSADLTVTREDPRTWIDTYSNPVRRRWAEGFVSWIGQERLSRMGYETSALLEALNTAPKSLTGSLEDITRIAIWKARARVGQRIGVDALHIHAPT